MGCVILCVVWYELLWCIEGLCVVLWDVVYVVWCGVVWGGECCLIWFDV